MIFFDEAGNSGANLLDKDQPSFLLLSHDYNEQETLELIQPLLDLSNATELHFKDLKKFQKFRNAIIDCINHSLIQEGRICHYVAHKKFMINIQIVDQLMEPVFYNQGVDIYQYGYNLSTANILYVMGTVVWDKNLYENMCSSFVKWVRSGKEQDCKIFYDAVDKLYISTRNEEDKILLSLILLSTQHLDMIVGAFNKFTLDATLSCFNAHCHFWADKYKEPFDITFDNSKQIEYWRDLISFLTHSLPEAEVGYGSRKHKYPLLINSLKTSDSHLNRQLQLADLLASAMNYAIINIIKKTEDDFSNKILDSKLFNIPGNSMWPTTKMTPEELDMTDANGINPLDFLADEAIKNPNAFNRNSN